MLLFSALLQKLADGKHHVIGRSTASEAALCFGKVFYTGPYSAQDDTSKKFSNDGEECDPTIVSTAKTTLLLKDSNNGAVLHILRNPFFLQDDKEKIMEFREQCRSTCFEHLCRDAIRARSFVSQVGKG